MQKICSNHFRSILWISFFLIANSSIAQHRTIELTLKDGYTGLLLKHEEVKIEIQGAESSIVSVTDAQGRISFDFETERSIQYHFECTSGDFLRQTRNRYFGDNTIARIEFHLYPSKLYEKRIEKLETDYLSSYKLNTKDKSCLEPTMNQSILTLDNYIYSDLQLPYNYGDAGFDGSFLIEFLLTKDGKPRNVKILSSTDPNLDKEVIRLIRLMPSWNYGECQREKHMRKMKITVDLL